MYLPTAYWSKLQSTRVKVEALQVMLDDLLHEAVNRRQASPLGTCQRHARDLGILLAEMSGEIAKQDVDRNLPVAAPLPRLSHAE